MRETARGKTQAGRWVLRSGVASLRADPLPRHHLPAPCSPSRTWRAAGPRRHPLCFWGLRQSFGAAPSHGQLQPRPHPLSRLAWHFACFPEACPEGPAVGGGLGLNRAPLGLSACSCVGRWLAWPTVSRSRPATTRGQALMRFLRMGPGPAPCQSGPGTRFMNRLPARGGGLPLAGRFHGRKASRHHSGVGAPAS